MKVEFNNLYTHFIFTTIHREPIILEMYRERIEKYITGIVYNNACQLYAIYANPELIHFLVSRSPNMDEECLAGIVANSSARFINENKLCKCNFQWQLSFQHFLYRKLI
jgi:putative transposase